MAINRIVLATSAVGGVSAAACVGAAAAVVALGGERVAARDRLVVALLLANAVYSIANIVPLNLLRTDFRHCGDLALPFPAIRFWRGWWFAGNR